MRDNNGHDDNAVEIHYCYPTSDMAKQLGKPNDGGYYVVVGVLPISPLFKHVGSAEGFCRNNGLTWKPHRLGQ